MGEDDRDDAGTLKERLTCMGHGVRTDLDGGTALQTALAVQRNLVFLDLGSRTLDVPRRP